MLRSICTISLGIASLAGSVKAHEFWIEPLDYTIAEDARIGAELYNGQGFGGIVDGEEQGASRIAFFPQRTAATRYFHDGDSAPIESEPGAAPAFDLSPLGDGLHVIAYVARPATLDYDDWEKFQRFVDHKDLGDVRPLHEARGLPDEGFVEVYSRYSKTLVAVGDGAGADLRTGMETEFVALANPYTDDMSQGLPVRLVYANTVRSGEQIELYEKGPDNIVTITLVRTDDEGVAILPVRPGYSYMADAVVLREPSAERADRTGAVWETLWANITFEVPASDSAAE